MLQFINIHLLNRLSLDLLSILCSTFIKGSLVFTFVYLALLIFKNLSPELKHLIWLFVICGFVLIPLVSMTMPVIQLSVFKPAGERGDVYRAVISMFLTRSYFSRSAQSALSQLSTYQSSAKTVAVILQMSAQTSIRNFHWSFWVLIIWVTGIFVSYSRVVIGRISIICMNNRGRLSESREYGQMLKQLSKRMGIDKEVVVRKSSRCRIPFTSDVFRPIVVLPVQTENWREDKIRAVLSHELAHIRRKDYLTQYIARAVCSIFWFVPLIWIAYFILHLEQEKACDSMAVCAGTKPADYAGHILDLAYFRSRRLMMSGLFMTNQRKVMLEKRIVNVLSIKGSDLLKKGGIKMRAGRWIAGVIFVLALTLMVGSCATTKQAISEADFFEAFSGTWVNTDYVGDISSMAPKKIVRYSDGAWEYYDDLGKTHHSAYGKITITEMWTDLKGDVWYKAQWECINYSANGYEYGKITDSGHTLEYIITGENTPIDKWEPDNIEYTYRIYFLQ
jgi:beta-lactamase regulating signal transducer with metallopeptidase domain